MFTAYVISSANYHYDAILLATSVLRCTFVKKKSSDESLLVQDMWNLRHVFVL